MQLLQVSQLLHIQPIRTSPYNPQTDGLVETLNQIMLQKTAKEKGKNWDKLLLYVLFAYWEVPQLLHVHVYGRQARGPLDVLRETWKSSSKNNECCAIINMRKDAQNDENW